MPPSHQPPNSRLRFQHMIYTSTKSRVVRQQTAFGVKIPEEVFDDEGEFKIPMWIWQKGDGGRRWVKVKQEEVDEEAEAKVNKRQDLEVKKQELASRLEEVSRRYLMELARMLADAQRVGAAGAAATT